MATPYPHQTRHYQGSTPPRPTGRATGAADIRPALTLLDAIADGQNGYIEISVIMGDPSDRRWPTWADKSHRRPSYSIGQLERMAPDKRQNLLGNWGHIYGREWHTTAGQLATIAQRCLMLGQAFGNVYVSAVLYESKDRNGPTLPGRLVFVDDAPAAPTRPYSLHVETSAGPGHGYYVLAERVTAEERGELARRGAAALGGDKSGADTQQIVRVPGTYNTKRGGRFPVRLTTASGPTYTADELRAAWPAVERPAAKLQIDDALVNFWYSNIDQLLDGQRLPRRIKNPELRARYSRPWADTSKYRYALAQSLVLHGYPDAEIAALLYHLAEAGSEAKGSAWLAEDVARCISKARAQRQPTSGIHASGLAAGAQPQLPSAPAERAPRRKGRPAGLTADALLAWYQASTDGEIVVLTVRETAEQLGISTRKLATLERELRERGDCYRQTAPDRRLSWVVFGTKVEEFGTAKNPETAAEPAENTANPADYLHGSIPLQCENPNDVWIKEHTPPAAPVFAPAGPPAAVTAGRCVSPSPEPDHLLAGEHGSADDWAALLSGGPVPVEDLAEPPADATAQLNMLDGAAPPRLLAEGWRDCRPARASQRRYVPEALHPMNAQPDPDLGRPRRPIESQNDTTTRAAGPPPAAPAATPPAPIALAGFDLASAQRALDAGKLTAWSAAHGLDRDAVLDIMITLTA